MIIEEALAYHLLNDAVVSALAGDRGYPQVIPQEAALPAWAYQRISGPRLLAHDGPTGLASPRFQITCTGNTYGEAKGLCNAIRVALDGYKGLMGGASGVQVESAGVENEIDGYNQATGKQTVRLDLLIWHKE